MIEEKPAGHITENPESHEEDDENGNIVQRNQGLVEATLKWREKSRHNYLFEINEAPPSAEKA
jgi:hypothetical protein